MNIFPGQEITINKSSIIAHINDNLDSVNKSIHHWIRMDERIYDDDVINDYDVFYLFYNHPVHDYLNKLFLTNKDQLLSFMKERINFEREEGIDIIVMPNDFSKRIICNHDGEIYLV